MKIETDTKGVEYLQAESIEDIMCIRFIEKAIIEEIIRINPKAIWAAQSVEAVLDEEGEGIVGYPEGVYIDRP